MQVSKEYYPVIAMKIGLTCHCEERSDEAISAPKKWYLLKVMRLLRCARNDLVYLFSSLVVSLTIDITDSGGVPIQSGRRIPTGREGWGTNQGYYFLPSLRCFVPTCRDSSMTITRVRAPLCHEHHVINIKNTCTSGYLDISA